MDILKVSAKSNPNSVAGALAGVLRERGAAEIQAIGAGALNQAVKAVAIARGFVAPSGGKVPGMTSWELLFPIGNL
jgi:stage V sporulation protein S